MMDKITTNQRRFHSSRSKPRSGFGLADIYVILFIVALSSLVLVVAIWPTANTNPSVHRARCKGQLKQITLALHNYHDTYGSFPPAYTTDANGKPLHSWRTLLLPFAEQPSLYSKIDLSKSWDHPANADAFSTIPTVYQCPAAKLGSNQTTYLAAVNENSCLRPNESCSLKQITDGSSNTIIIVEVPSANAVHWMSPNDADEQLILDLGSTTKPAHVGGFHTALVDGSVRFIPAQMPVDTRRALISVDGGEEVEF